MPKARAIVKRQKAVRNIRKITKTMQMIATAKFQKSLRKAVGTKPFTMKIRELVGELAANVADVSHPLLRQPTDADRTNRIAVVVLTANRGLAGAYNGNVLRKAVAFMKEQEAAGMTVDLYVGGKKGAVFFNYQKRKITRRIDVGDPPASRDSGRLADDLMKQFTTAQLDAVYVLYMNFISTGVQKPDIMPLLPLAGVGHAADQLGQQLAEKEAQIAAGSLDAKRRGADIQAEAIAAPSVEYDFYPAPQILLDELLPLTIKAAFYQTWLDSATSEHVARMIAMKSATDNAEKLVRSLGIQANRARQSQITTELAEIMGGVEAMES